MSAPLVGQSIERVEDPTLLRGAGQYADDLPVAPGTAHACFLRSPHAHAEVLAVHVSAARAMPGVVCVLTGADLAGIAKPFITGVKVAAPQYALAVDRVRYVGEPVALVVARDRYLAEDALGAVTVEYRVLPAVVDARAACAGDAPRLHPQTDGNVLHERTFVYGDPAAAFAAADHTVEVDVHYPRNACTPVECACVVARHDPGQDLFEVTANFQGPYTLHPVMARALGVPGNRLRLRTPPDSGGSFGVKQSVFPYVVAVGLAAKLAGCPVKWVEDRLEHLMAATSATARHTRLRGAFAADGRLLALAYEQLEDCGAYLRAPEPATLYRMHGNMSGAYDVQALSVHNRVVVTNRTPTGLNRGFGGPQVYFPLERLMDRAAAALALDPLSIRTRNLVAGTAMPYRTASGALLDAGDYPRSVARAVTEGGLEALQTTRAAARAEGRLYGIGMAAVVEPSISNMGYITTLLTPAERERSGAKNGALATATVAFDPSGALTVHAASIPQGQGHRTVLAQVVGDVFGLQPDAVMVVMDHDTAKDPWSIASGNYSSRFAGVVAGAAHSAAATLRERLAQIAAPDLNVAPADVEFVDGVVRSRSNPDNALPLARVAAKGHWSPLSVPDAAGAGLRETCTWSMPELTEPDGEDRINSSGAYGFIFDFCGVEVDRDTGAVTIDRYVTLHDAGTLLNPMLADGQIRGAFAHGLGAALLERFEYGEDGSFLSGTFADYLPPGAVEVPALTILHDPHPSPLTPLGAKGLGEGNCMSTPVCVANAVADALAVDVTELPLTRSRVAAWLFDTPESPPIDGPSGPAETYADDTPPADADGAALTGTGERQLQAAPAAVWALLLDPDRLAGVVPGCDGLVATADGVMRAELELGVGPVKGRFAAEVRVEALEPERRLRLRGGASGPLGASRGECVIELTPRAGGTHVSYRYRIHLSGKVAAVGGRLLDGATRSLTGQLLRRLDGVASGDDAGAEGPPTGSGSAAGSTGPDPGPGALGRLLRWLGLRQ